MFKKLCLVLVIVLAVAILVGCGKKEKPTPPPPVGIERPAEKPPAEEVVYTCPMHPEVISDKPGECPECGMNLVKKK